MEMKKFLKTTSMDESQVKDLLFFHDFLEGKYEPKLSSRIVMLYGEAGIGKTFIARTFVKSLDIPIYYVGQEKLEAKNIKKFSVIRDMCNIEFKNNCLIYIDDLSYQIEETEFGGISMDFRKMILELYSKIKNLKRAGILITSNYLDFEPQILDRTDVIIEIMSPSKQSKEKFLSQEFGNYIDKEKINQICKSSVGYNFRDLSEVIRKSYRYGNGKLTHDSIKKAIAVHEPVNFRLFDVHKDINLHFSDVIGREDIKKLLKETILIQKSKGSIEKFKLKRTNLLIFHGEAGLGKTFMAKAFAGEMGYPLVNLNSFSIYRKAGPFGAFDSMSRFTSRFKDCIILVDEADKLIGRSSFEQDGPAQGMLNELFDGIKGIDDAIIILCMNNLQSFGAALHDRFTMIEFKHPNYDERKAFFENKIEAHSEIFREIDVEELSRKSDRMSFRELEKIWNSAVYCHISTSNKIGMDEFRNAFSPFKKEDNSVFG